MRAPPPTITAASKANGATIGATCAHRKSHRGFDIGQLATKAVARTMTLVLGPCTGGGRGVGSAKPHEPGVCKQNLPMSALDWVVPPHSVMTFETLPTDPELVPMDVVQSPWPSRSAKVAGLSRTIAYKLSVCGFV